MDFCVIYSCFLKKSKKLSQKEKERAYINLVANIIASINKQVDVVFDMFNKKDFEAAIIKKLQSFRHVTNAHAADSQKETGIKFVDNLCSTIRLHLINEDAYGFYDIIQPWVKEVKEV